MNKISVTLLLLAVGLASCTVDVQDKVFDEHSLVREENGSKLGCIICDYLKNQSANALDLLDKNFDAFLHIICFKTGYPYQSCIRVAKTWEPAVFKGYMRAVINREDLICGLIFKLCDSPDLSFVDVKGYVKNILANKPPIKPRPKPTLKNTYTILAVNDIHLDPQYSTDGAFNCHNTIVCCRKDSTQKVGEKKVKCGPFGMTGPSDLPPRTFEDFLLFQRDVIKPDMMFQMGDNIVHELDKISEQFNLDTTTYISNKITEYLPNTKVFMSIGNHESFPVDQYDQMASDTAWLLPGLAEAYGTAIPQASKDQLSKKGFYSERIPEKNLKVISLFGQVYDSMNFYLLMRTFDPLGQLLWLQRELEASETIDEDVFIIMHIPLGTDFAIAKWNDVFNALMERFANTVVSLFSGHTHSDHLKFLTQSDDKSKVYMQNFIGNSLTTYSNYEPSFRVFKVDSDTNQLIDYDQYRLDLEKWNKVTDPNVHAQWDKVYSFKNKFNVSAIDRPGMQELYDRLMSGDDETMKDYISVRPPYKRPDSVDEKTKQSNQCDLKDNTRDVKICYQKYGFSIGLEMILSTSVDFYVKVN